MTSLHGAKPFGLWHYDRKEPMVRRLTKEEMGEISGGLNCNDHCTTFETVHYLDGTTETTVKSGDCDGTG